MSEARPVEGLQALEDLVRGLSPDLRKKLDERVAKEKEKRIWVPLPGPQTEAYWCDADEMYFGGTAGGGKSDLLLGLALTRHKYALVLRRKNNEVRGLEHRMTELVGQKPGGQGGEWKFPDGKIIHLGGCQYEDDKLAYQGVPHDLKGFDEICNFTESQYRFIIGWNRSADPNQRCRVVCTGNPPITPEGLWVLKYWAPWLDKRHSNPAKPGELRWFTTIAGEDVEVDGPEEVWDGKRNVKPRSRTFIPSEVTDNPYLMDAGYDSVLAALPSGLREAMLEGDFTVGLKDDRWQVIPTDWVTAAQDRWRPDDGRDLMMTAIGVDPAQGGENECVIAPRYGTWWPEATVIPGKDVPLGRHVAAAVVVELRHGAAVIIDIGGGYGTEAAAQLGEAGINVVKFNGAGETGAKEANGPRNFYNKRAEAWWRLREALDPSQPGGSPLALPPDPALLADLTAPRLVPDAKTIKIEPKEKVIARISRSPDRGDAVVMSWSEGQKQAVRRRSGSLGGRKPRVNRGRLGGRR